MRLVALRPQAVAVIFRFAILYFYVHESAVLTLTIFDFTRLRYIA